MLLFRVFLFPIKTEKVQPKNSSTEENEQWIDFV
jgi:hypothetical protein